MPDGARTFLEPDITRGPRSSGALGCVIIARRSRDSPGRNVNVGRQYRKGRVLRASCVVSGGGIRRLRRFSRNAGHGCVVAPPACADAPPVARPVSGALTASVTGAVVSARDAAAGPFDRPSSGGRAGDHHSGGPVVISGRRRPNVVR